MGPASSVADVRLLLCVPYVRCLSLLTKCSRRSRSSSPSCFFPLLYTLQVTAGAMSFWSPMPSEPPLRFQREAHVWFLLSMCHPKPCNTQTQSQHCVFYFLIAWSTRAGGQGGNMWSLPLKAPGPHHLSCSPLQSIKYWDWGPWAERHQGEDTLHLP